MHFTYLLCIDKLPNFSTKASLDSNISDSEEFKRCQSSSVEFCNRFPVRRRQNSFGTEFDYLKIRDLAFLRWCGLINNESLPSTTRIRNNYSLNVDVAEATVHRV